MRAARARTLCGGAAVALLLITAHQPASAQERRIATLAPPGSAWMKLLDRGAKAVEKGTQGRIRTKYYAGGSQGDERAVVRKMRGKGLDGAALTSVGLSMIDSSIRVLELPRLFRDLHELDYVRGKMWPYVQRKFEAKGYMLGEPGDVGWIHFMSVHPVRTLQDLREMTVWMWTDDAVVRAMYKKLGVTGVPLGVPSVLASLQSGRINACYNSPLGAVALQWASKVRYMTSMPMSYAIGASVVRKDVFDQGSARDREIQLIVFKNVSTKMRAAVRADNRAAERQMARRGVEIVETPPELVAAFDRAAEEVWHELVGELYSKKELDLVLGYRNEFRAAQAAK